MKKVIAFTILAIVSSNLFAQTSTKENSIFYVNVFINDQKDIYVENDLVEFENVSKAVKKRIYEHPFKMNENVVYRIYADKDLMLGYIMDVEQEMYAAYNNKTRRERHLLETVEMEIDGPNWFKKLEGVKFDLKKG